MLPQRIPIDADLLAFAKKGAPPEQWELSAADVKAVFDKAGERLQSYRNALTEIIQTIECHSHNAPHAALRVAHRIAHEALER